jgi:hypothetical protein
MTPITYHFIQLLYFAKFRVLQTAAVHGGQEVTGREERAAEAIGARGAHGKGKRDANGSSMSCWCC